MLSAPPANPQWRVLDGGSLGGRAKQALEDRLVEAQCQVGPSPPSEEGASCAAELPATSNDTLAEEEQEELLRENPNRFTLFPVR